MQGGMLQAPARGSGGLEPPQEVGRNIRGHGRRQPPPLKTISWIQNQAQDFGTRIWYFNQYEIWSELGPYGSVGAHTKTGKRYILCVCLRII